MLFIKVIIKTLLITQVCQSITIYQLRKRKSNLKEHDAKLKPYKEDRLSYTSNEKTLKQPDFSNIYPAENHRNTECPVTRPNANEQPAIAGSLRSETLHEPENLPWQSRQQPASVDYNNKIIHTRTVERASPMTKKAHAFSLRNQRNLKENQDDKLIEQNREEIRNANQLNDQQQYKTSAAAAAPSLSSSKEQPSTLRTSHEIRYLHDIFLNYPKNHRVNFGHTELSPVLFEKRFETQKEGNRYRGEIMWLDNTGGFAHHYWDLAQGEL